MCRRSKKINPLCVDGINKSVELFVGLGSGGVDNEGVHYKIIFAIYLHCSILMFVCIIAYGGRVRGVVK
jgi:hypothetical protein